MSPRLRELVYKRKVGSTPVTAVLGFMAWRVGDEGESFFSSNSTTAEATGASPSTVKRAIKELLRKGLIYCVGDKPTSRGYVRVYCLNVPAIEALPKVKSEDDKDRLTGVTWSSERPDEVQAEPSPGAVCTTKHNETGLNTYRPQTLRQRATEDCRGVVAEAGADAGNEQVVDAANHLFSLLNPSNGSLKNQEVVGQWFSLGLSLEDQAKVVQDVLGSRRKTEPIRSWKFFDKAMQRKANAIGRMGPKHVEEAEAVHARRLQHAKWIKNKTPFGLDQVRRHASPHELRTMIQEGYVTEAEVLSERLDI